jgi:protocatechuate 3,4-dioxygenase beta subunit
MTMKILHSFLTLTIALTLLTACASTVTETASAPAITVPATEAPVTAADPSSANEAGGSPTVVLPTDAGPVQSEKQVVLSAFSQSVTAAGELLVLYGHVLDRNGQPLNGYAVEIWQVDANGIYDHPGDSNTAGRDMGFQFYGMSLTDKSGMFAFRTIVPARYEPRPRHIHFKVKKDGVEVLTSQFYFTGDVDAAQLGPAGEMLVLVLTDAQDTGENTVKLAFEDIVVDTNASGSLTLTPSQVEGPYYPVVDLVGFDNDLASVE